MNTPLIANSISKGISYSTYRTHIKEFIKKGLSTGIEQSDAIFNYSTLNDKRMDRLDKTLSLSENTLTSLNELNNDITLLVISEGWCGDAAQILPVIHKIAEASSKITLKIIFRDENPELMNLYLTNGGKAIPKVLIINEENNVLNSWGPRPSTATKMVLDYKEKNGVIDDEFKKDLQMWYNKDKGNNTQQDLINLIKAV